VSRFAHAFALVTIALAPAVISAQPPPGGNAYLEFLRALRIGAQAELTDATARLVQARGQAEIMKAEAENKRLENALKEDKLRLWRYQNTPTPEELKRDREVSIASATPHVNHILSGTVLNTLLNDLKIMHQNGYQPRPGQDVKFPTELDLKRVHVTCTKGNIGPLRKGVLDYPLLLWRDDFADDREKIDRLAQKAYEQAITQASGDRGKVIEQLERAAAAMENKMFLLSKTPQGQASASLYLDAKKFFRQFDDMIDALRQPNIGEFLSGRYEARGATASELVTHMLNNGLIFAPATPGSENAYIVLHRYLASYANELRQSRTEKRINSTPPGFKQ